MLYDTLLPLDAESRTRGNSQKLKTQRLNTIIRKNSLVDVQQVVETLFQRILLRLNQWIYSKGSWISYTTRANISLSSPYQLQSSYAQYDLTRVEALTTLFIR